MGSGLKLAVIHGMKQHADCGGAITNTGAKPSAEGIRYGKRIEALARRPAEQWARAAVGNFSIR